ncbi:Nicotinamide/nicotinic acid mononucleotide adenylyltransferase 2 [Tritrichomonas musculus]|uniref:Nicotinamide/nicotinic acid mononucleotide adenylyltransferase 2 n=1 Tax=Tritrichomonas musculus TaxID=1915356 RepID=A0ABR2IM39_9EUKA
MVQKCLEGAKSAGAEVKLYQISDLKNIKAFEGRRQAILISKGSFCPIHKGHFKLFDISASFLSKELQIDTLHGIISPKSDHFVISKYNESAIGFEHRCEISRLACEEHNSQKAGNEEIVHIVTDTWDGSQIDFIDFLFVYNRLINEINEKIPTENLLVLFVCSGDMLIRRHCSKREFIVGISTKEFRNETETNIEKKMYICNDQMNEEDLKIKVTKDNFDSQKELKENILMSS